MFSPPHSCRTRENGRHQLGSFLEPIHQQRSFEDYLIAGTVLPADTTTYVLSARNTTGNPETSYRVTLDAVTPELTLRIDNFSLIRIREMIRALLWRLEVDSAWANAPRP